MTKIISVTNVKGGVGKSTSALFISNVLADEGQKVLLIDIDSQNSLTSFYFDDYESISGKTILEAMIDQISITECIYTVSNNIDFIPSDIELCNLTLQLTDNRDFKLHTILEPIKSKYDFIVIDTPPSLHMETKQSLVISDYIIIPTLLERWAVRSIDIVLSYINDKNTALQNIIKTHLDSVFILPTSKEKNRKIQDIVLDDLKVKYKSKVLEGISRKTDVQKLSYIGNNMSLNNIHAYNEYKSMLETILKKTEVCV